MPSTTPLGIHFPLNSDPPQGDAQMQLLATDVDNLLRTGYGVNLLAPNSIAKSAPLSSWASGISVMWGTEAAGWWATPAFVVVTVTNVNGAAHRHVLDVASLRQYRDAWSAGAWAPVNDPFASAVGNAAIVAPGGTTNPSLAVTFPAGRFSAAPIVTLTMGGGSINYMASFSGQSATGFTAIAFHNTVGTVLPAATYNAHWHAFQATPSSGPG